MNLSERINDTNAAPWVIEEIKQLEAERGALAAYVEEIKRVRSIPRSDFEHDGRRVQLLIAAIDETPTTSLAQRDARMKAEALDDLAWEAAWSESDLGVILSERDKYHHQAEGEHHD